MNKPINKLRWKNLKTTNCPSCGSQLRKLDNTDLYVCVETCKFKINEQTIKSLVGYKRQETSKSFHVDGFVRGFKNPSPYGGGYCITDEKGELIERKEIEKNGFSNNDGEVRAVIRALELCEKNDEIFTDSRVAEIWIKSGKSKARPDLLPEIGRGNELMHLKQVAITWVPRERNMAGIYNERIRRENRNIKYKFYE